MSFFLRRFEFSSVVPGYNSGQTTYCVACSYSVQIAQTQVSPKKYNQ